jgi:hypothetical protein
MKKNILIVATAIVLVSSFSARVLSQDTGSLLDLVKDTTQETEYIKNAFKSTRVINGQSIEMLGAGSLDFRILHRFGPINSGVGQLFGIDQSSIRLSFDYAPYNDLLLGFGRSSKDTKDLDGFIKYRWFQQSVGAKVMPVSIVLVAGVTCRTTPYDDPTVANYLTSNLAFFQQVLVGRKFSDDLTLQISPTLVHYNLVPLTSDRHDIYSLGFGGRIRLSNRISFTFDWYHPFNRIASFGQTYDPLAIGIDIETGGHVFQIHLTNCSGMNERAFITQTTNNWLKGGIQLGFNISRIFQL